MLSNVDFAALLKSGSSNGLTSDGRSRFGLEQVKTWDKQNDAKGKKKPPQFGKTPTRGGDESAPKSDKYRDRAFERRKDVVTSEEAALEAVVSKLDAEQTKFLGGDVEHTHLVKGLDYALLRKIREQEKGQHELDDETVPNSNLEKNLSQGQNKTINIGDRSNLAVKKCFKDFRTSSAMAEALKNMLHNPDSVFNISKHSSSSSKQTKSVSETISRMGFYFDLSDECDNDLPTIIARSKKDWADGLEAESYVSSLLSKEIGSKLSSIFGKSATLSSQNERQVQKRKRKEQLLEEKQKNSVVSVPKIVPKGIIEDIFADVGRYIPVGMLEEGEERSDGDVVVADNERGNASTVSSSASETGRAKGIFANLLPSFPSKIRVADTNESLPQSSAVKIDSACVFEDSDNDEDDIAANDKDKDKDREKGRESKKQNERKGLSGSAGELELELEGDDKRISGGVDGDLMAPIRAILAAQAVKERAALARSEAKASNSDGVKSASEKSKFTSLAVGADGRSRVHRDVFGVVGNTGAMGGRVGDAMGHGSYDDYGGDNETYDSDHEDEDEGKDKIPGGKTAEEVENGGPERSKGKDKEPKKDTVGRDFKRAKKQTEPEKSADSSGNWRNSSSSSSSSSGKKDSDGKGGERQSAVRPRSDNNRAARRAEKH